ncbi:hypothetical protein G4B88_010064 [Cannabis sativa]|uniref:DUF4283 domain-containing protein n=1 Tax=Cannabis sativa TaxID=3483 RepID=A0A7J6E9C9_CANSA|nr:hypothetical protein G4B88_010064 [Cannabis sativa]
MESFIASKPPLKGKCFSCNESSVKLSPCVSSLKALSSCCLYGKVIAPMVVDEVSVLDFVTKVWKKHVAVVARVDVSKDSNVFKFSFDSAEDRFWALDNGPWCIRGYTLVLQDWTPATNGLVVFKSLRVWIQLHNLPHEYFSVANRNLLGGLVGEVVQVDLKEDKPALWENFLKVQVDIDFNKPLFAGCFFDLASGVKKWIQVKFEKIGIFCYFYGCLGHQRRGCKLSSPVMVVNNEGTQSPMHGPWLSISSSYLDVFSGPNSYGAHGLISAAFGKSRGSFPLLPASAAEGVEDPKGKKVLTSRRPRHSSMVTSRGGVNLEEPLRMEWHPKNRSVGSGRGDAISGMGGEAESLRLEKAPANFPCLMAEDKDRSMDGSKGLKSLNFSTVGVNELGSGPSSGGPSVGLKDGLFDERDDGVEVQNLQGSVLDYGSGLVGPAVTKLGLGSFSIANVGPAQYNLKNISYGPQTFTCSGRSPLGGICASPTLVRGSSSLCGPALNETQGIGLTGQPLAVLPNTPPEDTCVGKNQSDEDKALSIFFQGQENLLHDLKHFGKLDLYEVRKIGGDIGVPTSSDVNERTTPFKKRKFEASASLCSRPHKIHRKYPGVIRDFPWHSKKHEDESKVVSEEPSENSSTSPSRGGHRAGL